MPAIDIDLSLIAGTKLGQFQQRMIQQRLHLQVIAYITIMNRR